MTFIDLAVKAALIYAGSFVLVWIGAMSAADEFLDKGEPDAQSRKQAVARHAGLQMAVLPVVVWFIWTCLRAAHASPSD